MTADERKRMLEDELCSHCAIGSKDQLRVLKKELMDNADSLHSKKDVVDFILSCPIETQYEKMIKILEDIINKSPNEISRENKDRIIKMIQSRTALKALFPPQVWKPAEYPPVFMSGQI